jgi:PAS domain S-box-containing protein
VADRMTNPMTQNETRLYGIIQAAMEAIITVDQKQNIVMFNPMAEKLFRCPATDAIGAPLGRFIPERFRAAHAVHVERFGATGISDRQMGRDLTLFGLRADGEEFPIEASISQIDDASGKLYKVMLRDITARRKAQAQLLAQRGELERLSAAIEAAREDEKTRIARELHDDLGQRLTALKMDLSVVESMLPDCPSPLAARIRTMHELIDSTVQSVRRLAADLRPVMLDDLGLVAAIDWLAAEFSSRYGIATRCALAQTDPGFDGAAASSLYRMVQEALNNVARHANATAVEISLSSEGGNCVIRVCDNGQGIDNGGLGKPTSFGLLGMSERTRMLCGKLNIHSTPGQGTTIEIIVPMPDTEAVREQA